MASFTERVKRAFKELKENPPRTLKKGQSKKARRKQIIAIALAKARRRKK